MWSICLIQTVLRSFSMRYCDETREFWALWYKMFLRVSFLCVMGGDKGHALDEDVLVNFAVPDRKILQKEVSSINIDCAEPGIIEKNIENFSRIGTDKSYKICFDGKKIAPGFGKKLGEVDLFGYENFLTCMCPMA